MFKYENFWKLKKGNEYLSPAKTEIYGQPPGQAMLFLSANLNLEAGAPIIYVGFPRNKEAYYKQ